MKRQRRTMRYVGHGCEGRNGVPFRPAALGGAAAWWVVVIVATFQVGCNASALNPQFPLTSPAAREALREMREQPVLPERPIVVVGGLYDPGLIGFLADELRCLTHPDARLVTVTFIGKGTFAACREHLIDRVRRALPNEWMHETTEVDVVAFSMGGLVARDAAMSHGVGGRLKIARLFTISTPHRGARLAELPTFDRRTIDMRSGSMFLRELDEGLAGADYELIPYVRLDDAVIGSKNAAPPCASPIWVPNPPLAFAHLGAAGDPRIVADIARRLRGETPFTAAVIGQPQHEASGTTHKAPRTQYQWPETVYLPCAAFRGYHSGGQSATEPGANPGS